MSDRAAFLDQRRGGLGGTDVAAIMGTHPHMGPWDVWASKVLGFDQPGGEDAEIGQWLERPIAEWAAGEMGAELLRAAQIIGEPSWMRASPDFWLLTPAGERAGLEVKCTDQWSPDQVQWYMLVADRPVWLVAEYVPRFWRRTLHTIEANADRQRQIREVATTWWQRHVVEEIPPEVDGSDAARDWLGEARPKGRDLRAATDAEEQVARTLADVDERIGELDQGRAALRNWLRSAIGGADGLYFTGGRVSWSRKSNRLTVEIR